MNLHSPYSGDRGRRRRSVGMIGVGSASDIGCQRLRRGRAVLKSMSRGSLRERAG